MSQYFLVLSSDQVSAKAPLGSTITTQGCSHVVLGTLP